MHKLSRRQARWALYLSQFNFQITHTLLVTTILQLFSLYSIHFFLSQGDLLLLISLYCMIRLLPYLAGSHTNSSTCLIQKGMTYNAVLVELHLLVTHLGLQFPTLCGVRVLICSARIITNSDFNSNKGLSGVSGKEKKTN